MFSDFSEVVKLEAVPLVVLIKEESSSRMSLMASAMASSSPLTNSSSVPPSESQNQRNDHGHHTEQLPLSTRPYRFSERTQSLRPQESSLAKKRRLLAGQRCILLENGWICCNRLRCVSKFDKEVIQSRRSAYLGMSCFERKTTLKAMLQGDRSFRFEGNRVCQQFIIHVLTFSNSLIAAVKELPSARASASAHPCQRDGLSDCAKVDVLVFLRRLAESCGDRMPDSAEIHLPYHVKADVYKMFIEDVTHPENAFLSRRVSQAYFYSIWKQGAPDIKIRKIHRFTKCTDCEFYRAEMARAGLDLQKCERLKSAKSAHVKYVMQERLEYASKRDRARRSPEKFCSLIVDGADQSAYGLPHLIHNTKAMRGERLKVRLIALKEHLPIPNVFFYLMTEEFETGANHVIEVVHRFLTQKAEKGPLPPTLYVQVDNCWRENKNKYFMAYFENLVAMGVVVEAFISFLPVGHTHEDIDQVFSRTAVHLRSHDAVTMTDLAEELSASYSPRPTVSRISAVANFSGLCDAVRCLQNPPAWTQFQYFHFHRDPRVPSPPNQIFSTNLSVRENSTSAWIPFFRNRGFLKIAPDLRRTPSTKIRPPDNYDAVIRAIETAETLINSQDKMRSLRTLAKEVYSSREQPFHWHRRSMIELNGAHTANIDEGSLHQRETNAQDVLSFEYAYERGDMVAAKPCDSSAPFWVAQVEKIHNDCRGICQSLTVRWYEPNCSSERNAFEATYVPSFLNYVIYAHERAHSVD